MSKQLVIAAAGAVILGPVGFGLTTASTGFLIGSTAATLLFPESQKSQGPRLSDLRVSGTEPGPIPFLIGYGRTAGQIIWASERREIATTTEQGKGGGGASSTTYTYEVDLMYLLADNECAALTRIWNNGKLVYNVLAGATSDTLYSSADSELWSRVTLYSGADDQLPDPVYEAAVGLGNAPAYRGRTCVFIESLQLDGNGQIPNLTFEISRTTVDTGGVRVEAWQKAIPTSPLGVSFGACAFSLSSYIFHEGQWDANYSNNNVKIYRVDYGKKPVFIADYAVEVNTNAVALGQTDVSGIMQKGSASNAAVFWGGETGIATRWTLDANMAGGAMIWCIAGDYMYCGRVGTTAIYKHLSSGGVGALASNLSLSSSMNNTISATSTKVYACVFGGTVNVLNASDLSLIETWAPPSGANTNTECFVDGEDVYLVPTSSLIYKRGATGWELYCSFTNGLSNAQNYLNSTSTRAGFAEGTLFMVHSTGGGTRRHCEVRVRPTVTQQTETLRTAVDTILLACGLSAGQFDTSALASITKPVRSMWLSQVSPGRQALETLAASYFFQCVLSDKLYFRPRGGASVATIPYADIGAGEGEAKTEPINLKLANELEIPAQVALSYSNIDADFNNATEYSDRLLTGQASTSTVQVPLGLTAAEAKGIADTLVADSAASVFTTTISLLNEYARIEPTDIITITDEDGSTYRMRVQRKTESGPVIDLDLVLDNASTVIATGITSADYTPTTSVASAADTYLRLLDVPILRDGDDPVGLYCAFAPDGPTWPGAALFKSVDGTTYAQRLTVADKTAMGATTTALTAWARGFVFDETSSVTVLLDSGTLSSYTRDDIFNGTAPAYLIGSEIVYAANATLISANTYTLTGFLRGLRGTEWAMASHVAGEEFTVLSTTGLRREELETTDIGATRYYKAPTLGRALSTAYEKSLTFAAIGKKPFSPVNLRGSRASTAASASGVSLLLHMNGLNAGTTFVDSSALPVILTPAAGAQISTTQSKFGGSSMICNGSNSGLTGPVSDATRFSGDFAVECWVYPTTAQNTTGLGFIFACESVVGATNGFFLQHAGATLVLGFAGAAQITTPSVMVANTWQHVALTRSAGVLRIFVNGVQSGSSLTDARDFSDGWCGIGKSSYNSVAVSTYDGFIDEFRITRGAALYTGTFTPETFEFGEPWATDNNFSSVGLLLHADGTNGQATTVDNSLLLRPMTMTGTTLSTTTPKFGTASFNLTAATQVITTPTVAGLEFGAGDFTVECWAYPTAAQNGRTVIIHHVTNSTLTNIQYILATDSGVNGWSIQVCIGGTLYAAQGGTQTLNQWTHIAGVRSGSNLLMFVNGVLVQTTAIGTGQLNAPASATVRVGTRVDTPATYQFLGRIDEVRVTKGIARYTSAFTPPSSRFPDIGPQSAGVNLSWDRRTRYAKNFTNGFTPLGETSEAYEIDVFSSDTYLTLKRTLTSNTPLVNYTDADQITDFGALQSTVYVDVYQVSDVVGRGYKLRGAV